MSNSSAPSPLPPLNIPPSDVVVKFLGRTRAVREEAAIRPSSGQELEEWTTLVNRIIQNNWQVTVQKDVSDILAEHGVSLESISSVIWSHYYWDHTGDPSVFPSTTSLTVGPGTIKSKLPGYPANSDAPILESTYKGRELVEVSFEDNPMHIGRFRAIDYFGDGSFYLLDSPGHAIGHICGLACTTPDTFVLMGGDIFHHGGELRPNRYVPLPEYISPNPFNPATEPFFQVADLGGNQASDYPPEAQQSLRKLEEFDGYPNIFTIVAHNHTLLDVLDFYPKSLNDWHAKGYKELGKWQFVRDFREAVKLD
ncbi:hypothetical protein FRC07_004284 [Ceratobasidium sp. 392]|nr:hypothetical protein FRC07_004284 [Ceratobasidium sp. 392]